ncbi:MULTISPECIES: class III extradiol ring-cleavage dioxygenase [Paenibacillus]|uniref:DODA-type extradiol aromatic ring-opening family dioxygenase n=1 Tax=Paenibacillus TaxID=44249 RepID=UPI000838E53F|nr:MULTISPECIES: class III extradiol ring-cleavage dioxygenase [Paenibacillus]GIP22976.1 dioxygenase [Paenibacillus sp. J22TS3]
MTLPAFFVAHGSPTLALEDNEYTRFLQRLGQSLPAPKAIAVFSAHFDSPDQLLTGDQDLETIHDFYGFPQEMYEIRYPAPGSPELSEEIASLLKAGNLPYRIVTGRGLDHGAWVILRIMYPQANVPVISLSVDSKRCPQEQYEIGRMLQSLREQDVLIIGSGGTVHNLRLLGQGSAEPWAVEFDDWIGAHLEQWNLTALFNYEKKAPHAREAVPEYGQEHFIPLFYAMGAADNDRHAKRLFQDYQYGTLSLNCWQFGRMDLDK